MEEFWHGVVDFFKNAGLNILYGIIILIVGLIIVKLIKEVLKRILRKSKRDEAMSGFIVSLVNIVLEIIVLITALATMGINTASLIAVIGTCGVAIGLALKDSLGNIASGIMIIFNKPFKKDDYVEIAGEEGRITAINLFNTTLRTDDNTEIIVPNSEAVNNPIINYDACGVRRIVIEVAAEKGAALDPIKQTVLAVAEAEPLVSSEHAISVRMSGQDSGCIRFKLKCYAAIADYWTAKDNLTENVYTALAEQGVLTPNLKVDVYEGAKPAALMLTKKSRAAKSSSPAAEDAGSKEEE